MNARSHCPAHPNPVGISIDFLTISNRSHLALFYAHLHTVEEIVTLGLPGLRATRSIGDKSALEIEVAVKHYVLNMPDKPTGKRQ